MLFLGEIIQDSPGTAKKEDDNPTLRAIYATAMSNKWHQIGMEMMQQQQLIKPAFVNSILENENLLTTRYFTEPLPISFSNKGDFTAHFRDYVTELPAFSDLTEAQQNEFAADAVETYIKENPVQEDGLIKFQPWTLFTMTAHKKLHKENVDSAWEEED